MIASDRSASKVGSALLVVGTDEVLARKAEAAIRPTRGQVVNAAQVLTCRGEVAEAR